MGMRRGRAGGGGGSGAAASEAGDPGILSLYIRNGKLRVSCGSAVGIIDTLVVEKRVSARVRDRVFV